MRRTDLNMIFRHPGAYRLFVLCCLLLAWPAAAAAQAQTSFYVSPQGSDENPGTEPQPFKTIERARDAVRAVNKNMSADITVYLRGGIYELAGTLQFDPRDSGSNGFHVIYRAYQGEQPHLSGARRILGWTPVAGGIYKANVGALRFRQLYINGVRGVRARTPNEGAFYRLRNWDEVGRRVEISSSDISSWERLSQVEMVIQKHWTQSRLRLASFINADDANAFVTAAEPERTRAFAQVYPPRERSQAYYFENAYEFLDAPGEWYLNTQTQDLFYKPRAGEDVNNIFVAAPRLETLISIKGAVDGPVRDLDFYGLWVEYSTWLSPSDEGYVGVQAGFSYVGPGVKGQRMPAGIELDTTENVKFERNVIQHMGAAGIALSLGTRNNRLVGNVVSDVSGNGISVDTNLEANPPDARLICKGDFISNNYVTNVGRDYTSGVGIFTGYTDSTLIEHNEVYSAPYTGISVGWGHTAGDTALRANVIRLNRVHNVMRMHDDGAGIYTLSKQPGTLVSRNYIHDIERSPWAGANVIAGIYLDAGSSFITVSDNVIQRVPADIFQNSATNITFSLGNVTTQAVTEDAGLQPGFRGITSLNPANAGLPPRLLTAADSAEAIALDSVTFLRGPFKVTSRDNFSPDGLTRVMVVATDLDLSPAEDASICTARAVDDANEWHRLEVENITKIRNFDWLTSLVIKLDSSLSRADSIRLGLSCRGLESNQVLIKLAKE